MRNTINDEISTKTTCFRDISKKIAKLFHIYLWDNIPKYYNSSIIEHRYINCAKRTKFLLILKKKKPQLLLFIYYVIKKCGINSHSAAV